MHARRWVLLGTGLLVIGVAALLVALRWESAERIATSISALAAVAAVGVAVWAAVPHSRERPRSGVRVTRTGSATAEAGGKAVSGLSSSAPLPDVPIAVEETGDAKAMGGGDATSGFRNA
jgi:hypothetical protein